VTTDLVFKYRRITGWEYLTKESTKYLYKVTIESSFPTQPNTGATFEIYNPSDITDTTRPYLFLPSSLSIPNYYNKYVVYNQTNQKYAKILSYDMDTHLALLSDITNNGTWSLSDAFVVRKEAPIQTGSSISGTTTNVVPNAPFTFLPKSTYTNAFLRNITTGEIQRITKVLSGVSQISVTASGSGYASPPTVKIGAPNNAGGIQAIAYANLSGNSVASITVVDPGDGYTSAPIVTLVGGGGSGATATSTIFTSAFITTPFSQVFGAATPFEVLQYSYDNYSPFVYSGTVCGNSQPVAYDVSLNSLTLPNVPLKLGGRIAYYPYVYVVIENISTTAGNPKNLIYSNNPNNYKAVFRAPITDLNHPNNSPFVKLTGNGMKQTVSFKLNDDMHVSILLPNGELFEPIASDNPSGQTPNPLLQTSCLFSFERIQ
jgi:hypothetical protein